MKTFLSVLFLAAAANASAQDRPNIPMIPQTVFFRYGFSGILEFNQNPTRIVIGDQKAFQVERLGKNLVVRPVVDFGSSNLFVFFDKGDPKLFLLIASEDANPSHYLRVAYPKEEIKPKAPVVPVRPAINNSPGRAISIKTSAFDAKKDYLTVEVVVSAGPESPLYPEWSNAKIVYKDRPIAPLKVWAERREVQKDSKVKARFVFLRPNVPRDLKAARLVVPVKSQSAIAIDLRLVGGAK